MSRSRWCWLPVRVLRAPFGFELTIQGGNAVPRRMVLTANHLVVTYAP